MTTALVPPTRQYQNISQLVGQECHEPVTTTSMHCSQLSCRIRSMYCHSTTLKLQAILPCHVHTVTTLQLCSVNGPSHTRTSVAVTHQQSGLCAVQYSPKKTCQQPDCPGKQGTHGQQACKGTTCKGNRHLIVQSQHRHVVSDIAVHSELSARAPVAAGLTAGWAFTAGLGGREAGVEQGNVSWLDYSGQLGRGGVMDDELAAGAGP